MLGLGDVWVTLAFILCILSSLLCVVYGALNWHRGAEATGDQDKRWAAAEDKLESEL